VTFLLRVFFRLMLFVGRSEVLEVREEDVEVEVDEVTRLNFGILRGSISFCPSSSLSSSPDSYKILSSDSFEVSRSIASVGLIFVNNSLRIARPTTIDLLASSKPSLCLLMASNISLSVGLQSGPFPRFSSFSRANVARSLEYPHRLIRASMPVRTAAVNSVLARISSETLSRDGIACFCCVFRSTLSQKYIAESKYCSLFVNFCGILSCLVVGNVLINECVDRWIGPGDQRVRPRFVLASAKQDRKL